VSVESYDGNVCVRSLFEPIKFDDLRAEIIKVLGASYEQNILELLGSPWDKNKVKGNDSWFCSELIAYLYNVSQVITENNFLPNNVIPKEFSTRSNIDFLRGKATEEQWLKIMDSFVDD
jgi:hypothetical protein